MAPVMTWALQHSTALGHLTGSPLAGCMPLLSPGAWVPLLLSAPLPRCLPPLIAERKADSDNINQYINQKRQLFLIQVGPAAPVWGSRVGCPSEEGESCSGGPSMP